MAASSPQALEIATAECGFSGWLKKSGGVLKMQKLDRWVELYSCELVRYKKQGGSPNGTIRLNASVVCSASSDRKSFTLRSAGEKYIFVAKTTELRDEWVSRICAAGVGADASELGEDMLRSSCPNEAGTINLDQAHAHPCGTTAEFVAEDTSTLEVKEDVLDFHIGVDFHMPASSDDEPDGIQARDPLQSVGSISSDDDSIQSESTTIPTTSDKSNDFQELAFVSTAQLANWVVGSAVKAACAQMATSSLARDSETNVANFAPGDASVKTQTTEDIMNWQSAAHGGC